MLHQGSAPQKVRKQPIGCFLLIEGQGDPGLRTGFALAFAHSYFFLFAFAWASTDPARERVRLLVRPSCSALDAFVAMLLLLTFRELLFMLLLTSSYKSLDSLGK